jgi:hypothetical protein
MMSTPTPASDKAEKSAMHAETAAEREAREAQAAQEEQAKADAQAAKDLEDEAKKAERAEKAEYTDHAKGLGLVSGDRYQVVSTVSSVSASGKLIRTSDLGVLMHPDGSTARSFFPWHTVAALHHA